MLSNNEIKYLIRLKQKKYRKEHREFIAEGLRLCEELLTSSMCIKKLFISSDFGAKERENLLIDKAQKRKIVVEEVKPSVMSRFCSTKTPPPIAAWAECRDHQLSKEFLNGRRFLVLDSLTDPGNVGTLLRTANAFGWDGAILVGQNVEIYNSKLLRASMGAIFHFPVCCSNLKTVLSLFRDINLPYLISLPDQGDLFPSSHYPHKLAFILGSEAHGVSNELYQDAHSVVKIPMESHVESLNVAIAGGILLYLLR